MAISAQRATTPRSTVMIVGRPIYPVLAPLPFACFAGALVTDIVYWRAPDSMWETFSVWLISIGLVISGFAALAGLIDFAGNRRRVRGPAPAWLRLMGNALAILLSLVNAFVHSRDGYTAVVPDGLILSALAVAILLLTAWMGREMTDRVGVST